MPTLAKTLPFTESDDSELSSILKENNIALTLDEARKITELIGRDPTLMEAVLWGIQGSEHCSYKSSRNLLSAFLTEGKHIILGPKEDSGIVAMTDDPPGKRWGIAITHESHNKPSQVVPFEGSATGIGGSVRDVVCMGARVIGCMDLLRLGNLKNKQSASIASEVTRGIAGYGNPLGIPNLGGDTVFDSSYDNQCLVNAIALGIVREDEIIHSFAPEEAGKEKYDIILVGKPTDKSGFGGASFASATLEEEEKERNTGAVQEPNPFLERHLLASSYALFDWLAAEGKLDKVSFKDLGAGGIVCASVEQVADANFGAEIDLTQVHVSMHNLPPEVIACAETQERFCWTCHPSLTEHILNHYNSDWDLPSIAEGARASKVGHVTEDGVYRVTYEDEIICEAKALDITCGLLYDRPIEPMEYTGIEPDIQYIDDSVQVLNSEFNLQTVFEKIISHPNHGSKHAITRHYDKNVIGNTILEPGEADAGVIAPLQDLQSYVHQGTHPDWDLSEENKWRGIALAGDGSGRYGRIDPYLQGKNASLESMRNVIATGATPRALTDCLNYGNPEDPNQLWMLSEGIKGIADTSKAVTFSDGEAVPVISGNVSLYNGNPDGSSIDPSAIVCTVGYMDDARKAVSQQFKESNSVLFVVGERKDECGGSAYYEVLEELLEAPKDSLLGKNVPDADFDTVTKEFQYILDLHKEGHLLSCHDIGTGGLVHALYEMTLPQRKLGGDIGAELDISTFNTSLRPDQVLFTESGGFILEVSPQNGEEVENLAKKAGVTLYKVGLTIPHPSFTVTNGAEYLIQADLPDLHEKYQNALSPYFT